MTYPIERMALPIPRKGRPPKYPFSTMQVGDSIVVKKHEFDLAKNAAHQVAHRKGWAFVIIKDQLRIGRTK